MNKFKKVSLAIVFALILGIPVLAKGATSGIQISPLTYNFELNPGESKTAKVSVTNLNSEDLNYVMEVENFTKVSDEGAPSFAAVDAQEGVTTLADWITFTTDKEGTILAKKSKDINLTINVPLGAEPGGHYAAIFAKQIKKTAEGTTELGVATRVGVITLVSVPGETVKSASITEFNGPKIVWKGPVSFDMKVENTGTVHYDSKADIQIKSLIGKIANVALGTHTIIPKNSRVYDGKWNKKYPFGYYKVTASATDGNGQPVTTSAVFWAIPLIIVIPSLLGVIIIICLAVYLKRHLQFKA